MKRRDVIIGSALIAGAAARTAHAAEGGSDARFGDIVIPPAQEAGKEKHVPIITVPTTVAAGEPFEVTVEVGAVVQHPNTIAHHIKWIQLYAKDPDSSFAVELGTFNFGPTFTRPKVTVEVMLERSATLYAVEHCNLHGIWDYSVDVAIS
jgi:superoxide reductase